MRRATVLVVLVAAGALLGPAVARAQEGAPTPPPETGIGIGLAEAPTSLRDDPRAQVYVIDHVRAGSTITRRIRVRNGTAEAMTPELYVAPATIVEGSFTLGQRGGDGELPKWGSMDPGRLELAPRSTGHAELRIAVPKGTAAGEYYGAAVAEVTAGGQTGVRLASRVGVRIYLSVGDGAAPASDFEVTGLRASRPADGRPVVTAEVRNTGGRALDMSGTLRLSDGPAGLSAGPFSAELGRTLPIGGRGGVRVVLDKATPAGPWKAALTLRSGTVEHTVAGTITFPRPGQAPVGVRVHRVDRQKGPAAVVALLLLLGVAVGLLLWWLARRRHDEDEDEDEVAGTHVGVRAGAG